VSEYLLRAVKYGIYEAPTVPFEAGEQMRAVPQAEEDLEFGRC
jgi:hypothetical protein